MGDRRRDRHRAARSACLRIGCVHRADELLAGGATGDDHGELGSHRFVAFEQPPLPHGVGPHLVQRAGGLYQMNSGLGCSPTRCSEGYRPTMVGWPNRCARLARRRSANRSAANRVHGLHHSQRPGSATVCARSTTRVAGHDAQPHTSARAIGTQRPQCSQGTPNSSRTIPQPGVLHAGQSVASLAARRSAARAMIGRRVGH